MARTPGGVLAIDLGSRKCGFAASDALGLLTTPLSALRHEGREEELLRHIETLLGERDVATVVVGLPLNLDGSAGERALLTRGFVARLRQRFPALDVQEWDERLTTKEAEARLRELGRKGRAIRTERDSWSALVLLEDWLHSHGGFPSRD